jgi:hypothetical protein
MGAPKMSDLKAPTYKYRPAKTDTPSRKKTTASFWLQAFKGLIHKALAQRQTRLTAL